MTPELKTRWVDALKSGNYPKGKDALCVNGHYCCLGVLAEIEDLFTREEDGVKYVGNYNSAILTSQQEYEYFGDKLIVVGELMQLNDNNDTFDEVIEHIEKNL